MVDFFIISSKSTKNGGVEIFPKFIIKKSKDLMIRGGDFYAVWIEDEHRWSTDEDDLKAIVDNELKKYAEEHKVEFGNGNMRMQYMWDADSGVIDKCISMCKSSVETTFTCWMKTLYFQTPI